MASLRNIPAISLCGLLAIAAATEKSHALDASGTTIAVIPSAAASGQNGRRVLEVTGPVFMGDRVQTGPAGEAQIKFKDNTKLVVGRNSLLTIDAFVFDSSNTARQVTMNAFKGAFRFITGNSRKQAYTIRTPTTTIGIRGTRFDLAIEGNGQTNFALFEGEARLCDRSGRCKEISGRCAVAVVPPRGQIADIPAGPERSARLAALFPYVVSQARLNREFQVDTSSCSIRHARLEEDEQLQPFDLPAGIVPGPGPDPDLDPEPAARGGNHDGNDKGDQNPNDVNNSHNTASAGNTNGQGNGRGRNN